MNDASPGRPLPESHAETSRRSRSTAGRLLRKLYEADPTILPTAAAQLHIDPALLDRCRDEGAPLEPVVQMMIAALALELLPDERSLIHQVYGQAQTALRLENGSVESHMIYPKRPFT